MIQSVAIQFTGLDNETDVARLQRPLSLELRSRLNYPSTLNLRYAKSLYPESYTKKSALQYPSTVSLVANIVDADNQSSEKCLFRGPHHRYQVKSQRSESFMESQYIDPIVTTFEINEPTNWEGESLSSIVDSLLKTSYAPKGQQRKFKSDFRGDSIPSPKFISNTGMSKFDFLHQMILGRYGYFFYFDPSSDKEDRIVFFRPEMKPSEFKKINAREIFQSPYTFETDFNRPLSSVHVHSDSSSSEKSLDSIEADFSLTGKAALNLRSSNGVELVSHYYFPNENQDFCKSLAESKLLESAIHTHRLTFQSSDFFYVGHSIQVEADEKEAPPYFEGYYLIMEATHTMSHGHWTHEYIGVRA